MLEEHHEQIAAVVIEPLVQAAAGMVVHPPGFLRGVRELTRRYGVLLIADEVAVGMGRTGTMFASEQEDVRPDLLCLAKGLTGGYLPLAATLATTEIFEAFLGDFADQNDVVPWPHLWRQPARCGRRSGDPGGFRRRGHVGQDAPKIARLGEHLDHLADHPHVRSVRQCGLIAANRIGP